MVGKVGDLVAAQPEIVVKTRGRLLKPGAGLNSTTEAAGLPVTTPGQAATAFIQGWPGAGPIPSFGKGQGTAATCWRRLPYLLEFCTSLQERGEAAYWRAAGGVVGKKTGDGAASKAGHGVPR